MEKTGKPDPSSIIRSSRDNIPISILKDKRAPQIPRYGNFTAPRAVVGIT
jgi:hypothetical protein